MSVEPSDITSLKSPSELPEKKQTVQSEADKYCEKEVSAGKSFLDEKQVVYSHHITEEEYHAAADLCEGVSGAKKITLLGKEYILKSPVFTETFRKNFEARVDTGQPIEHRYVSESDDSFAHFARKEVVGSHLCEAFGISVPKTTLVKIGDDKYGSLQEFVPKEKATVMNKKGLSINAAEIDFPSSIKQVVWQLATENIDQHSGNIMLEHLEQSDDSDSDEEFAPSYRPFPIDYGLIFPRHQSVYPEEVNQVKKGLYCLMENKKADFNAYLSTIEEPETILQEPNLDKLMMEHEKKNLIKNVKILKAVAAQAEEKLTIRAFTDSFVSERQKGGKKA